MWVPNLDLKVSDRAELRRGKLGDKHMHAAQKLLALQYPHLQGLKSTLLSQKSFPPIIEAGGFIAEGTPNHKINMDACDLQKLLFHPAVQILNEQERDHWVTTSYHGSNVMLYDSAASQSGELSPSLEKQICEIYQPAKKGGTILVTVVPVQQQEGSTSCGLYSIAAALNVALGENLRKVTYDDSQMRAHLEKCFDQQKLTPFPTSRGEVERCQLRHITIQTYCICEMPDTFDTEMIECEECKEWFHCRCVEIANKTDWHCPRCA